MADLRRDIEALAKLRNDTATSAGDRSQAQALSAQASALKDAEKGWRGVATQAKEAKTSLGGLAETLQGFGRSAVGGTGIGSIGSVLAAGSIGAAVAAVGAIVGQSIRMAYEFEKASTRAAQQLSIGTGPNLAANVAAIQRATRAGLANNISRQEMAQALQTYGLASGAGVQQSAAAASGIGTYARGYGLDPNMVASTVGAVVAMSGRSFNSEAAGIFGAAEDAGNLGRRLPEFISVATSTLAQLQAGGMRDATGAQAAALVANIASRGGYFGTAAGVSDVLAASQTLSTFDTPKGIARGVSAGLSDMDILFDRSSPKSTRAQYKDIIAKFVDPKQSAYNQKEQFGMGLESYAGMSPKQAGTIADLIFGSDGSKPKDLNAAVDKYFADTTPGQSGEAARAAQRAAQYKNSGLGGIDKLGTDLQEKELEMGQTLLHAMEKASGTLDKIINGDWKVVGGILAAALLANTIATGLNSFALLKNMGVSNPLKWVKNLGRGAGAVGEAGEVAEGAEAAGGGAGLLGGLTAGGVAVGAGALALAGGATYGIFGGLAQAMGGSSRMSQVREIGEGYTPAAAGALSNYTNVRGGVAGLTNDQAAILNATAKKHGIPPLILAAILLQEHGGRVANTDQIGGNGKSWFQIDSGYHMDWLKTHSMGRDFGSAADYASGLIDKWWMTTHSSDAVFQAYNAGLPGRKTTYTPGRGLYEQSAREYANQFVAAGGTATIPDGNGGSVHVAVKHMPARKPNTQSRIKNR
jgi:hypothetical protein